MTHCTTCGHPVHPPTRRCPRCGAARRPAPAATPPSAGAPASLALPLTALVCGLLSGATLHMPTPWGALQAAGAGIAMTAAVALGCIAVARHERGQALAMAGVVLGAIAAMGAMAAHL